MSLVYLFIKIQLGYLHAVLQSRTSVLSIHMARKPGFLLLSRLGYGSILSSELHRCNLFPLLHTQKPSARIVLDYVMHPFAFLPLLFCIVTSCFSSLSQGKKNPFCILTPSYLSAHVQSQDMDSHLHLGQNTILLTSINHTPSCFLL